MSKAIVTSTNKSQDLRGLQGLFQNIGIGIQIVTKFKIAKKAYFNSFLGEI